MENLLRDIRFAWRGLARSPGFAIAAILCLALGIGANTAVFSVLRSVLLQPLPYDEPEQLVMVWGQTLADGMEELPASGAEFLDYRQQAESFTDFAAIINRYFNITGDGDPERVVGARVSASLFPLLGAEAATGRTFLPEEDRYGNQQVVLLTDGLWRRRFGADPNLVGDKILLSGTPHTVVGILPRDFELQVGMFDHELYIPIAINYENLPPRDFRGLYTLARLAPGVSLEAARGEMKAIAARFEREYPDVYRADSGWNIELVPLHQQLVGDVRPALLVLMAAVALVLLIACANVANLLLVRSAAREKEVAIRAALGIKRRALVRAFLIESLLLAFAGGALGLLLAWWGTRALVSLEVADLPRLAEVGLDGGVLVFTFVIALGTGLLFGLVPALRASRPNLQSTLKEGGKTSNAGGSRSRLRGALVVAEVALALVVLVGAGLLIRSFQSLQEIDPGFRTDDLLTFQLALSPSEYPEPPQLAAFVERLEERLETLPGVESAGLVTGLPLEEVQFLVETEVEGDVSAEGATRPSFDWRPVSPGFFETLGIPLVAGRQFTRMDHWDAPQVAIVDQELARRYWPGENPIGKRVRLTVGQVGGRVVWREVVGVVGHIQALTLEGESREQIYTPFAQSPFAILSGAVHTQGDPMALANGLRQAIWQIDPDLPVDRVKTMEDVVSAWTAGRRSYAWLLAVFAGVALVLASIGVYGVLAYSVSQRTQEIGIRMALGAPRAEVLRLVVFQGLVLAVAGVVIGTVASLWANRYMESLLYGVGAGDLTTLLGVAFLLTLVAAAASWLPARRAARVEPIVSLRSE